MDRMQPSYGPPHQDDDNVFFVLGAIPMQDRVDGVKRAAGKHAAGCGVALSYVPVVRSSQPIFFLPCLLRARPPNYRCPRSFPIRLLQSTTVLARTRRFLDSRESLQAQSWAPHTAQSSQLKISNQPENRKMAALARRERMAALARSEHERAARSLPAAALFAVCA